MFFFSLQFVTLPTPCRRASQRLTNNMDAAPPTASELSEESRWSGHTSPHKLAQALSLLLPLLPLDTRARAACVCRAWRAAAAPPVLWAELSFEHCAVCIHNAALTKLCA